MDRLKLTKLEKIYSLILLLFFIFSFFLEIPTDSDSIGISSRNLAIGDRLFYINESVYGYGYESFKGNFLYPFILKLIKNICYLFGSNEFSKLFNFIAISITSILSILSLRMLNLSAICLFSKRVAIISSVLYLINPYSYFFALSGGITNYIVIGVTSILYIFCLIVKNKNGFLTQNSLKNIALLSIICIYLSSLRPTAILFSLTILFIIAYKYIRNIIIVKRNNQINNCSFLIVVISIGVCSYNLFDSLTYSTSHLSLFTNEGGSFFGFSRDLLREKLDFTVGTFVHRIKVLLYFIVWKITDFISGISDIRDTHNSFNINQITPFILRVSTGLFFLYPLNLLCLSGIFFNWKMIFDKEIYIVILASFIAISPSILGVAMSRYLIMFYSPFLIFAAKTIDDIIDFRLFRLKENSLYD